MTHGISYWSMKDGLAGTCPVNDAIRTAKSAGFAAIELCIAPSGALNVETSLAECREIRRAIDRAGLVVQTLASGMSWSACPSDPRPEVRKRAIALHRAAMQRAAWLGCDAMLFVPGATMIPWDLSFGPIPYRQAVKHARTAVGQLAKLAEKLRVDLCVENVWNGLFYSPLEFRDFIDSFASRRVKMYFDVGNILGLHQDPPDWVLTLGKRIGRVHVKDFKRSIGNLSGFCDLLEGDVPWSRTMAALRQVGYDRTVIAEMMPHRPGLLDKTARAMKRIVSMGLKERRS